MPEEFRTNHAVTKFKTIEDMARAYTGLEKRMGVPAERLLTLPEDRSSPEAMADIYRALGRPDAPEGYGIQVEDTMPDTVKGFAADLAKELHPLGATTPQVAKAIEVMNKHAAAVIKAENDATAAKQAEIDAYVKSEWGENADVMRKEVTNLLKDAAGDQFEALKDELAGKLGTSPILFKYLASQVNARREGAPLVPGGDGRSPMRINSVSDAQAAKNAFLADTAKQEAWKTASHPNHKAAVEEFNALNKIIVNARKAGKK